MGMTGHHIASTYRDLPKDKIPLPPKDAKVLRTGCDYCIVGCAYNAYVWPLGVEGGPKAADNAIGVDFPVEEAAGGNWPNQNQHTIGLVNGEPVNVIVMPANSKVTNRLGNHSIRGGRIAQKIYNPYGPTADRNQMPMLRVRGMLTPISWDSATTIIAAVMRHVMDRHGEMDIAFKGHNYHYYQNTYAWTKHSRQAIQTPNEGHHDKPNSSGDSTATEDSGMDTFASNYIDFRDADVVMMVGDPLYADQTIIFTEFMMEGKGKAITVLPRRTKDNTWAEKTGGVSFLVYPGTDQVLLNAISRVIVENGWEDKEWVKEYVNTTEEINFGMGRGTKTSPASWRRGRFGRGFPEFKEWILKDQYATVEAAEKICGVKREDIIKAAKVLTNEGKAPRPKCTFANEKGLYWSNNYLGTASLVNIGMLCGSGNRPGQMFVRGGGHQRGWVGGGSYPTMKSPERSAKMGRMPMQQDKWTLAGRTKVFWSEATQWIENSMGSQDLADYVQKHTIDAPQLVTSTDEGHVIQTLIERVDAGNLVVIHPDPYLRTLGALYADFVLPVAQWGEDDFARNNGERILKIYEKITDPPGQGKPDWWIHKEIARKMGFDWNDWKNAEEVFIEAARFTRNGSQDYLPLIVYAAMNKKSPYDLLRQRAGNGYRTPLLLVDGKLIETPRLHDSTRVNEVIRVPGVTTVHKNLSHFNSTTGKGFLYETDWRIYKDYHDLVAPRKEKGELWITNGRVNEIWQSLYDDLRIPVITQRYPMHFVEIHPDDAKPRGIETGDLVSIENDLVWVQVAGWWANDDDDMLPSSLIKKGYMRQTKGAVTAMALVYDADAVLVKPGVAFQYFIWPGAPSQAVSANISDPLSSSPRYKTGRARIRKIGVTQFKGTISMAPKDLVPARRRT